MVAPWVKDEANALLRVQWCPEQIAAKLHISHEPFYQHVYVDKAQGEHFGRTCAARSKRKKCYAGGRDRRGQIYNKRLLANDPCILKIDDKWVIRNAIP